MQALLPHPGAGRPAEPTEQTIQRLQSAMTLYRGPFLDNFSVRDSESYTEWLERERERWQQRWLDALAQLVEAYTTAGEWTQAIDCARRGVAANPLQEGFHRALMRLHLITGNRAAALMQYRLCHDVLSRELAVGPDAETVRLYRAIVDGALDRGVSTAKRDMHPRIFRAGTTATDSAASCSVSTVTTTEPIVGRADALGLFEHALAQREPPFAVLHVTGAAGVGKSALLREFARQCAAQGRPALSLDARDFSPTAQGFQRALCRLAGADGRPDTLPEQIVLLIDSYERLAPIDHWLREDFLPQLPYWAIVVLAGNNSPAVEWQVDLGWPELGRVIELDNLSESDSADYLEHRQVPGAQHAAVLRLTQGHPLTLALAAEVLRQRPDTCLDAVAGKHSMHFLVGRFLADVPSVAHRAALEACSLVRVMSEPLLAALLGIADARALFVWLERLAFVAASSAGIRPHDLVRAAVTSDLRRHNPPWYRELHTRASRFYQRATEREQGRAQDNVLLDTAFLHESLLVQQAAPVGAPGRCWRTHHDASAHRRFVCACRAPRPERPSQSLTPMLPSRRLA
jgi:hypothetical protein